MTSDVSDDKMPRKQRVLKIFFYLLLWGTFAVSFFLGIGNFLVSCNAVGVYETIESLPDGKCALVLGCSPLIGDRQNLFFLSRMDAAAELYHSGKAKKLLLSGDNGRKGYNEPEAMRQALLARGVPDAVIYCDYAGFSTLDSMIRARDIFGMDDFIIVSQRFHCERALFLARAYDLTACGFAAKDIYSPYWKYKNRFRESFARPAALLDVICFRGSRFGGEKVSMDHPQERAE